MRRRTAASTGPGNGTVRPRKSRTASRSSKLSKSLTSGRPPRLAEPPAQLAADAVHLRPDGAHGQAERPADLGVVQLGEAVEQEHLAIDGREPAQGVGHARPLALG